MPIAGESATKALRAQHAEIARLKRERHHIYDLLARIHRDGGNTPRIMASKILRRRRGAGGDVAIRSAALMLDRAGEDCRARGVRRGVSTDTRCFRAQKPVTRCNGQREHSRKRQIMSEN